MTQCPDCRHATFGVFHVAGVEHHDHVGAVASTRGRSRDGLAACTRCGHVDEHDGLCDRCNAWLS